MTALIKTYLSLTKPGIIMGNAIAAVGGFLLAAKGDINFGLLVAFVIGLSLVIASACVFNNFLDRGIDAKMSRTAKRALVTNQIPVTAALAFAVLLGVAGFGLLIGYTNLVTVGLGLFGLITYVLVYGYFKRHSVHGTVVGSLAGAIPPAAGYCAVTGRFDLAAGLLFLLMVFWQMPHFYAIAMYRQSDYAAAAIPVLPIKKGHRQTKNQMIGYIGAFAITAAFLSFWHYADMIFLAVVVILSLGWLRLGFKGFKAKDETAWAKQMFRYSLILVTALYSTMAITSFIH